MKWIAKKEVAERAPALTCVLVGMAILSAAPKTMGHASSAEEQVMTAAKPSLGFMVTKPLRSSANNWRPNLSPLLGHTISQPTCQSSTWVKVLPESCATTRG